MTLICTESADKEFEREMLALLGDSEYRRYTYKYEHPTARSADSPSDLTPLLENTDDNVFIILSDNEVDIDRILAALASADTSLTSRGRTAPASWCWATPAGTATTPSTARCSSRTA